MVSRWKTKKIVLAINIKLKLSDCKCVIGFSLTPGIPLIFFATFCCHKLIHYCQYIMIPPNSGQNMKVHT